MATVGRALGSHAAARNRQNLDYVFPASNVLSDDMDYVVQKKEDWIVKFGATSQSKKQKNGSLAEKEK